MKILVTGGASGLGEAITRECSQNNNYEIYFTYNKSEQQAQTIEANHSNVFAIKCDFGQMEDLKALTEKINFLNIDILINNAYNGSFISKYFHKTDHEQFINEYKMNIIPTIMITQAAIGVFRKKKFGKIITILTSALNMPPIGSSIYIANKGYLEMLSRSWAIENAKFNITSNTISPSFMLTGFTQNIDERIVESIRNNNPLKKLLTTEDAAKTIYFMCQSSNQMNGVDITLNSAESFL